MLQIDHVYEFFSIILEKTTMYTLPQGVLPTVPPSDFNITNVHIFNDSATSKKIFFYDQEPVLSKFAKPLLDVCALEPEYAVDALVTSEHSKEVDDICQANNIESCYYFFHGFAALDWYRGYYALNYRKPVVKDYAQDYITFNRIITNDRSYRIYWVSKLAELGLLPRGQISFNVTDNLFDDWRDEVADPKTKLSEHARRHAEQHLTNINKLIIDRAELPGSASADIPREADALWNIVTETVFYYDKLHLTEKIFKPIVNKQPFMLLAAPGNLAYLRSYGFETFGSIIDESYDDIQDPDQRIEAVAKQLHWYCNLTAEEKQEIIQQLAPIVEYNFRHFYGEFRKIIARELVDNLQTLYNNMGYDVATIARLESMLDLLI